jgi:hypothetical protein
MGKEKMNDWEEVDHLDPDECEDVEADKAYLESEYRAAKGRSWLFKWVQDE